MKIKLNTKNNRGDIMIEYIFMGAVFLVGIAMGVRMGVSMECNRAIQKNAAHYEVNPKTGDTSFVWNTTTNK